MLFRSNNLILKPKNWNTKLTIHTKLDTRVSILKIHPGITPQVVGNILCGNETRAVIIETYGCGNAPNSKWFMDEVMKASASGKILMNVSQCISGSVNMNLYANGKELQNAGVVCGYDSTTESALGKLFFLLGQSDDNARVRVMLESCLRGEISK